MVHNVTWSQQYLGLVNNFQYEEDAGQDYSVVTANCSQPPVATDNWRLVDTVLSGGCFPWSPSTALVSIMTHGLQVPLWSPSWSMVSTYRSGLHHDPWSPSTTLVSIMTHGLPVPLWSPSWHIWGTRTTTSGIHLTVTSPWQDVRCPHDCCVSLVKCVAWLYLQGNISSIQMLTVPPWQHAWRPHHGCGWEKSVRE